MTWKTKEQRNEWERQYNSRPEVKAKRSARWESCCSGKPLTLHQAEQMKYLDRKLFACDGKQHFTKERADAVAERTRRKKSGGARNAYKCKVCGHWHVGRKRQ